MRKIFLGLLLMIFFSLILGKTTQAATQAGTLKAASPTAQPKVNYSLPYPGILPDHPLYSLKMLRDRLVDFLIRDPLKKTEFLILMADKRLGAGKTLIESQKADLGQTTINKGEDYLLRAIETARLAKEQGKDTSGLTEKLESSIAKHLEVLGEVLQKAPEQAKPGLQNALKNSRKGYQRVLELKTQK